MQIKLMWLMLLLQAYVKIMGEEIHLIAKHDYVAQGSEELNICKNEKLILIDDSKKWWKVQNCKSEQGFVPSNYVKKVKPSLLSGLMNTLGRKKPGSAKGTPTKQSQQVPDSMVNPSNDHLPSSGVNTNDVQGSDHISAIAKYEYVAQRPDEMTLYKGENIFVMEKSIDGWWKGKKSSGETGWFPSNYVNVDTGDTYPISDEVSMYAQPSSDSSDTLPNIDDSCLETVVALYSFTGSNSEELCFEKSERLRIIDKPVNDPEWWRAKNEKGNTGLVPRNYVQTVSVNTDSGFPRSTPESQSSSSISGQSQGNSTSGVTSSLRTKYHLSGPHSDKDWYYGDIPRADCDHMLNIYADEGDFIVRESESNVSKSTLFMTLVIVG